MSSRVTEHSEEPAPTALEPGRRPVPGHYSSMEDEYSALTDRVALLDRSYVGRLSFTGQDALDLLNRLSTNELLNLEPGMGTPTILTSNKGRVIDLLYVFRLDGRLLVLTSPQSRQKVVDWIDFYTIIEDVSVQDQSIDTAMFSVAGPEATGLVEELAGEDVSSLGQYESVELVVSGVKALVCRTDFVRLPAYDVIVDAAHGQQLWAELIDRGRGASIEPVGLDALEVVRVERGVPAHGSELTEDFNPLEADLLEFVSFTKGCYIGQEVVTRLNTYKKVQKHLRGLRWEPDADPAPSSKLMLDGKQVGVVTTAVRPPGQRGRIGLGYVGKAYAQPGTALVAESTIGEVAAEVVGLPFKA